MPVMMDMVLTRLRDFSCKTTTFGSCTPVGQSVCRNPRTREDHSRGGPDMDTSGTKEGSPCKLDIESALAWLRRELMEMRSQDQALIKQLMDLHTGIQELKQELSEPEEEEEEEEEEEGSCWDSGSEVGGSSSLYSSSGEVELSIPYLRMAPPCALGSLPKRAFSRRSSVP